MRRNVRLEYSFTFLSFALKQWCIIYFNESTSSLSLTTRMWTTPFSVPNNWSVSLKTGNSPVDVTWNLSMWLTDFTRKKARTKHVKRALACTEWNITHYRDTHIHIWQNRKQLENVERNWIRNHLAIRAIRIHAYTLTLPKIYFSVGTMRRKWFPGGSFIYAVTTDKLSEISVVRLFIWSSIAGRIYTWI